MASVIRIPVAELYIPFVVVLVGTLKMLVIWSLRVLGPRLGLGIIPGSKSKHNLQAIRRTISFYTFKIYSSVTEAGVLVCSSSAAVDGSVDCTVILRGGENTLIASLWRSSYGIKSWHQFRGIYQME